MKAKLIVDNREIEVEVSKEELNKLIYKTGYEKVNFKDEYFFIGAFGAIERSTDVSNEAASNLYEIANYYSSFSVAENNARADRLMRQLRRFAVENRKQPLNWEVNNNQRKYSIYYGTSDIFEKTELRIDCCFEDRHFGVIYFDTREAAQKAIEIFYDELIWYFTEYKDSL